LFFRDLGPVYDYLIQITFFPFLVYFLLAEKDRIRAYVSQLVRSRTSLSTTVVMDTSEKIVNDLNSKIRGFILGTLLSTGIVFIVAWLLFLSFRVEGAVVWAVLFSLLNILPFVGAILSAIPPLLISIVQFTSVKQSILLISLCLGLHLIYTNWLIPRTTGPRTELSPLVVVLAMMYWGFLWGAIGIFLAVPLTASLRSIWMQYRSLQAAEI
jgi:AI-2 transport protein TqsA